MLEQDSSATQTAWQCLHATYAIVRDTHPDVNVSPFLSITPTQWAYLQKKPRDSNPLGEREGAGPYTICKKGASKPHGWFTPGVRNCCYYPLPTLREWPWTLDNVCIVNDPHSLVDPMKGSCANCFYNGSEKRCSFRKTLAQDKGDTTATLDPTATPDTTATLDSLVGRGFSDPKSAQLAVTQVLQIKGFRINSCGSDKTGKRYACLRRRKFKDLLGYSQKTPCTWSISFKLKDGSWVIQPPVGSHNHPPVDFYHPRDRWECPTCKRRVLRS